MKAIETKWKGYRFRSRTEARWAVFFETCGIDYEYEPEGVILPSGPYLPDFRLRTYYVPGAAVVGETTAQRMARVAELITYVEVKGVTPTDNEINRCGELLDQLHEADPKTMSPEVLLAVGAPDTARRVWPVLHRYEASPDGLGKPVDGYEIIPREGGFIATAGEAGTLGLSIREGGPGGIDWIICPIGHRSREEAANPFSWGEPTVPAWMQAAYDAARSARFEFGETEKRWDP